MNEDVISVLLVDDHPVVRQGLRAYLDTRAELEVVAEAENGIEALDAIALHRPDVVLLDLKMPHMDGQGVLEALRGGADPMPQVIVLTSATDVEHVPAAVQAGAAGFVYKDIEPHALVQAIATVYAGQNLLAPQAMRHLMNPKGGGSTPSAVELTPREKQVLQLITAGQTNRQISRHLTVAEKTVKTHVTNILLKIGAADRTQAAVWAVRNGYSADA
ncbi:response regulator [Natronoglycomyces albus]|uniref:Response regulator transcription factor n=1 Tax=Natronoglycomyces albus TaxID=2811108 RepID=A0A895XKT6_9ACTN|nr:response regulator transcription factor [Natronoglycomyces albus]QSB04039.1 response regulator transcription factor [Natronoglycomyces albus]